MPKLKQLISFDDLKKEDIFSLLKRADWHKKNEPKRTLEGKILASCFFEPSTRTQLSFAAAMKRLGGDVIGFSDSNVTSIKKGESLHDTMKVIGMYCDLIVMRHPQNGSAKVASEATKTPVINAGDGSNEHPTQTLLDLFSIQECQGKLDNLNIAIMGDLKHARTAHSLALALRHFNTRLFFIAPEGLSMPKEICDVLEGAQISYSIHSRFEEVALDADVLYMTRLQEERFSSLEKQTSFTLKISKDNFRPNFKILHPLPRREELPVEWDSTPYAYYFEQAKNGLFVRMALLERFFYENL